MELWELKLCFLPVTGGRKGPSTWSWWRSIQNQFFVVVVVVLGFNFPGGQMFLEASSYLIWKFDQKEISLSWLLHYNVDLYNHCSVLTSLLSDQPKVTMPPSEKTSNVVATEGTRQRHPASLENTWVTQQTPSRECEHMSLGKTLLGAWFILIFFPFSLFFFFLLLSKGLKK